MNQLSADKRDKFLAELTELSRKYGIKICGCGCCGSPFLVDIKEQELAGGYSCAADEDDYLTWEIVQ